MALFQYNPNTYKLPEMPSIQPGQNLQAPKTQINNNIARSILDTLGSKIKAPTAFTQNNRIEDNLFGTQELGRQFIQQNLLPEFQQNTYNPFQRQQANQNAGSNLSLLGGANRFNQDQTRKITQPFYDQAAQVQGQFNDMAQTGLNDLLRSYYNSEINF